MSDIPDGPTRETLTIRIAALVKSRRANRGHYKSACAARLMMTRQRFAKIENGHARLYLDEVEAIMREFSIQPEEIWPEFIKHRKPIYKVDVPSDQADKVFILVNLVKGDEQG
jgi:transcriptional regulator with XRE-family HTH domain